MADHVNNDSRDLMRYIDEAKKACGDDRVTGEPLAQVITRLRAERDRLRAEVDALTCGGCGGYGGPCCQGD